MNVRCASLADLDGLRGLLASVELPTADLSLDLGPFLLAEVEGAIVACAGMEHHADAGLLRSVAVAPSLRGRGIAVRLCAEILQIARSSTVQQIYLPTMTAPSFFEKLGFARFSRSATPESIRSTREFRELCPDTSVLMHRAVPDDATSKQVAHFRDAYAALLRGEPAALLARLTGRTVYHLPGAHLGGGRLEGRDAILRRLVSAQGACDSLPEVEVLDAFGDDTVVVTGERLRARRNSRTLDQQVHVVWRFEQTKCVDIWAHFQDQRACDAFWEGWAA